MIKNKEMREVSESVQADGVSVVDESPQNIR